MKTFALLLVLSIGPQTDNLFALTSYYVSESPLSGLALRNLREAALRSPRVLLAEGLLYRKQGKTAEATSAFQRAALRGVPDPICSWALYTGRTATTKQRSANTAQPSVSTRATAR